MPIQVNLANLYSPSSASAGTSSANLGNINLSNSSMFTAMLWGR